MEQHPSDEVLDGLRLGGLDDAEAAAVGDHLEGCPGCRERKAAEARFDRVLRGGLTRTPAPAALGARLQSALAAEDVRLQKRRRALWGRVGLSAAAAMVLLAIGLIGLQAGWLGSREGSESAAPAGNLVVRGQLVCIGCARHGVDPALQARCVVEGNPEHVTGLQTPDGNLWRLAEAGPTDPILADRRMRGTWVEVEARPYPEIGYLGVAAVRRL